MDTKVLDEDSIDTEALQAQIDLSMSFAQNLVSSWIDSYKLPKKTSKRDLEKELTEYIKQPPRLGVGASIPEGHQNMSRETARLKGKLAASKRSRDDEELSASAPARPASGDDDDESRASAIKKKPRSDPFDFLQGKRKKKQHDNDKDDAPRQEKSKSSLSSPKSLHKDVANEPSLAECDAEGGEQSPKRKKKKLKLKMDAPVDKEDSALFEAKLSELLNAIVPHHPENNPKDDTKDDAHLNVVATQPGVPPLESDHKMGPTFPNSPRNPIHAQLLKRPLLNLTGPPPNSDDDESDTEACSPSASPKKKRKRRKRKKQHLVPEEASNSIVTPTISQPLQT